jgi:hypothetical protein
MRKKAKRRSMLLFDYTVIAVPDCLCQFDRDKATTELSQCSRPAFGAFKMSSCNPDDGAPIAVSLCKQHIASVILGLADLLTE